MNELDPRLSTDVPASRGHGGRRLLPAGRHGHAPARGRSDPYDRILDGRSATIERIYFDYDDRLYFGVTVDDDPGQ